MPTYIGFSTQHVENVRNSGFTRGINSTISNTDKVQRSGKKFRTTDEQLVIQDLINSFNIVQGQKPGKPEYGTTLWSFIFEPNTVDVRKELEHEIARIVQIDPRIILNRIQTENMEYGIMIQLELAISPFNNVTQLSVLFDQGSKTAMAV
jgi:phage baseplate assembly protein W